MTRGNALLTACCHGLFVGLAVGLFEAIRTFARPVDAVQAAQVLLGGAAAYAGVSLALTVCIAPWLLLVRPSVRVPATGVAVAFGVMIAARDVSGVAMHEPGWELWNALAAAVLVGVLVTLVAGWLPFLRPVPIGIAASGVMLGAALRCLGDAPVHGVPEWLGVAGWCTSGLAVAGLALRWALRRAGGALLALSLVLGLAGFGLAGRDAPLPRAEVDRPNVVLVTIDTLRADRVGVYGNPRTYTPNLNALGREGLLFRNAVTPIPLTSPAHASMLTGLMPAAHGVTKNWAPIAGGVPSIASRLKEQGYRTGAVVSALVLSDPLCGLASHFHHYDDDLSATALTDRFRELPLGRIYGNWQRGRGRDPWQLERRAARTTDRALRWLDEQRDAPFFLWVHYYDPHEPYAPPLEWARRAEPGLTEAPRGTWYEGLTPTAKERRLQGRVYVEHLKRMYTAEISYTDDQVGRLLRALEEWGLRDDTLLVVTSDHGEGLGEHGLYFAHGNYLYEEELRVPLIVRLPEGAPQRREFPQPVSLVDLAPTLLDYLGMQDSFPTEGRSLRPLIEGGEWDTSWPTYHAVRPGAWESNRSIYAVRAGRRKLIYTGPEWRYEGMRIAPRTELYDLVEDPGEATDLADAATEDRAVLESLLNDFRDRRGVESDERRPDEDLLRRLQSLGYAGH